MTDTRSRPDSAKIEVPQSAQSADEILAHFHAVGGSRWLMTLVAEITSLRSINADMLGAIRTTQCPRPANAVHADMNANRVVKWLEAEAEGYERANNSAFQTTKYRRQDHDAWPLAQEVHRLVAINADMLEALDDAVAHCGHCDGKGNAYTMADETQIGQPPGSSRIDCPACTKQRAAIAKAREAKP